MGSNPSEALLCKYTQSTAFRLEKWRQQAEKFRTYDSLPVYNEWSEKYAEISTTFEVMAIGGFPPQPNCWNSVYKGPQKHMIGRIPVLYYTFRLGVRLTGEGCSGGISV
jgi:beta-galactosidase/beta-glucuronidase